MRIARFLLGLLIAGFGAGAAMAAPAKNVIATVNAGTDPSAVAVNAATNRVYVANETSGDVTVIDGASNAVLASVKVGPHPQYIAVSVPTNRIFVSNAGDATLSVIDGATLAVKTLAIGGTGPIAINERRNQVYVVRLGNNDEVTIVDGAALAWYTAATDSYSPRDLALDEAADRLYVVHYASGDVRAIDLTSTSDFPPTVSIGVWSRPTSIALNAAGKRLFVIGEDPRGPISIVDTASNKGLASFAPAGHAQAPRAIVANATTNRAYAAFANEVVVIDGNTNALAYLPMPTPAAIALDPAANRIFAPSATGTLTVIDGASNAMSSIAIPVGARAVAVNPATHRVYVASSGVTVVDGGAPLSGPAPTVPAVNAQGLWWASPPGSESGWGINLTHQGDTLFATWFTYDPDGSGLWLVMSNGTKTATNAYSGTLYRTTGPAFSSATFDPSKVTRTPVGTATFTFTDADNGVLNATVNGATITKQITRQVFSAPMPVCEANGPQGALPVYQDLWWNAPAGSESGWGVSIAHQGNILFVTWFTYAADGRGMWLVGSSVEKTGNGTYSGTLYRVIGPAYSASPWDPARVVRTPVGQVAFSFSNANNGTMTYTVDGITQSKAITREVYAAPPTTCR